MKKQYFISFLVDDLKQFESLEKGKYLAVRLDRELNKNEVVRLGAENAIALLKPDELIKFLSLEQYSLNVHTP